MDHMRPSQAAVVNASINYSMDPQHQHQHQHRHPHRNKILSHPPYNATSSPAYYSESTPSFVSPQQHYSLHHQRASHADTKHYAVPSSALYNDSAHSFMSPQPPYPPSHHQRAPHVNCHGHQVEMQPPARIHAVDSPQVLDHHTVEPSTSHAAPHTLQRLHSSPAGAFSSFTVKPHYHQTLRPHGELPPSLQTDSTASMTQQRNVHQRSATLPASNHLGGVVVDPSAFVQPPHQQRDPQHIHSKTVGSSADSRIRHFDSYHTVSGYPPPVRGFHQRQRCYSGGASSAEGSTVTTLSVNGPQYRSYYTAIGGRVFQRTAPPMQVSRPKHHASSVSAFSADLERQARAPTRHRPRPHTRHHTALGLRDGFMSSTGNTASPWAQSSSDNITMHPTAGSLFTSAVAAAVDSFAESVDNMRKNVQNNGPVSCEVTLLDGREKMFHVPRSAKGSLLFEQVCKSLDLLETEYFGLTYRGLNNVWFWLSLKKKIRKYLPNSGTWKFEFQVKFYPIQPIKLKEPLTRYLMCLQIRQDIICKKLPCSFNTFAILGAYVVQAELGDHKPTHHGECVDYIQDMLFAPHPLQTRELLERIVEIHKLLKDLSPEDADIRFMENAKKLSLYGVDFHKAKDMNDEDLMVGVYHGGILVYVGRLRIKRFFWSKILKISYLRCVFRLFLRPHEHSNQVGKLVEFRCQCSKMAKRLWKACVEHHAFFRLRDQEEGVSRKPAFFAFSGATRTSRRFDRSPQPHRALENGTTARSSSAQPSSLTNMIDVDYGAAGQYRHRGKTLTALRRSSHQRTTPSRPSGGFIPRPVEYGLNPEWYATSAIPYPQSSSFPVVPPQATLTTACQTNFDDHSMEYNLLKNQNQNLGRTPNPPDSHDMQLQPKVIHHAAHRSPQDAAKNIPSSNEIIPRPGENVVSSHYEMTEDQVDLNTPTGFRPPREKSSTRSLNTATLSSRERTLQRSPFQQPSGPAMGPSSQPDATGAHSQAAHNAATKSSDVREANNVTSMPFMQPIQLTDPPTHPKYSPLPSRHVECHFHPITSPVEQDPFIYNNVAAHNVGGTRLGDSSVETISYQLYQPHRVPTLTLPRPSDPCPAATLGDYSTDKAWHDAITTGLTPMSYQATEHFPDPYKDGPVYAHVVRNEKVRPKVLKRASLLPAPKWRMSVIDISPGLTLEPLRGLAVGPSTCVSQSANGGGARSTWGVSQCGRYFYEVIVTGQQARSAVRIGWSVQNASLLLGEDRGGFGFGAPSLQLDGAGGGTATSQKSQEQKLTQGSNAICSVKITGGEASRLGDPLVSGDVVGCYLDLHRGSVFWSCNGNVLDDGLGLQIPAIHRRDPFFPTVAINNCALLVNFGESPFVYPPPANSDWLAVCQAPRHLLVSNVWQGWHLNPYDVCDDDIQPPQRGSVQFSADALVAQTHGSAWVGVRANRGLQHSEHGLPTTPDGVTPALNGNYYYEIVILELETAALVTHFLSGVIVGWSSEESSLCLGSEETGIGYGTDPDSFIIGSGKPPTHAVVGGKACDRRRMGDKLFKSGDVVGCSLDLDDWRIRWFVNGNEVRQEDGLAMKAFVALGHRDKAYFPTVSLKNCTVLFNFGDTPFRYPPSRLFFKPVSAAPKENVSVSKRQAPEKCQGSTWTTDCAELLKRLLVTGTSKPSPAINTEQTSTSQSQERYKTMATHEFATSSAVTAVSHTTPTTTAPNFSSASIAGSESMTLASHLHNAPRPSQDVDSGQFPASLQAPSGSSCTYYTTEYKTLEPGQPQVESVTYITPEGNRVVRTIKRSRITAQQNPQRTFYYHQGTPCPIQLMAELGEMSHTATASVLPATKVERSTCSEISSTAETSSTYDPSRYPFHSAMSTINSQHAMQHSEVPIETPLGPLSTSASSGFMHKSGGPGVSSSCVEGIPAVVTKTAYYCYHPTANSNTPPASQAHRPSMEISADEAAIRHLAQSINKRDSKGEVKEVTMFQTRHPCNATETTIVRKIRPVSNLLIQDEEQIV